MASEIFYTSSLDSYPGKSIKDTAGVVCVEFENSNSMMKSMAAALTGKKEVYASAFEGAKLKLKELCLKLKCNGALNISSTFVSKGDGSATCIITATAVIIE